MSSREYSSHPYFYLHCIERNVQGVIETSKNFSTVGNWMEWGSAGRLRYKSGFGHDSARSFSVRHCRACRALRPVKRRPDPTRPDSTRLDPNLFAPCRYLRARFRPNLHIFFFFFFFYNSDPRRPVISRFNETRN